MKKQRKFLAVAAVVLVVACLTGAAVTSIDLELIDNLKKQWQDVQPANEEDLRTDILVTNWLSEADMDKFVAIQAAPGSSYGVHDEPLRPDDQWQADRPYYLIIPVELSNGRQSADYHLSVYYPDQIDAGCESAIYIKMVNRTSQQKSYFRYTISAQDDLTLAHGDADERVVGASIDINSISADEITLSFYTSATEEMLKRSNSDSISSADGYFSVEFSRQVYPKMPDGRDDLLNIGKDVDFDRVAALMRKLEDIASNGTPIERWLYRSAGIEFIDPTVVRDYCDVDYHDDDLWQLGDQLTVKLPLSNGSLSSKGIESLGAQIFVDQDFHDNDEPNAAICQCLVAYRQSGRIRFVYGHCEGKTEPGANLCEPYDLTFTDEEDYNYARLRQNLDERYKNAFEFELYVEGE